VISKMSQKKALKLRKPLALFTVVAFNKVIMAQEKDTDTMHVSGRLPSEPSDMSIFAHYLLQIAEHQDKEAFLKIFKYYGPRIKSYLLSNGCPPHTAEDLLQQTMITIWEKAPLYNPKKAQASTWIFTIARNKKIDLFRKDRRFLDETYIPERPEDNEIVENEAEKSLENKQLQEHVQTALNILPNEQNKLLTMAYFENKTHQEIATETSLPLGTVKSRLRLALSKLRKHLSKGGQHDTT